MVEWTGVAIGGVAGAWMRYFMTNRVNSRWSGNFPLATLFINVTGAFLLGFLFAATRPHNLLDAWLRSSIGIGFIGSYTTFSTFTYEAVTLLDRRAIKTAIMYVLTSVILGLLGALAGARI